MYALFCMLCYAYSNYSCMELGGYYKVTQYFVSVRLITKWIMLTYMCLCLVLALTEIGSDKKNQIISTLYQRNQNVHV